MGELEKQICYLDVGDEDESFDDDLKKELYKKTTKNLYGYGDDYYKIIEKSREEGKEPNI